MSVDFSPGSFDYSARTNISLVGTQLFPTKMVSHHAVRSRPSGSESFSSGGSSVPCSFELGMTSVARFSRSHLVSLLSTLPPGDERVTPGVVSFPTPISPIVARGPLPGQVSDMSVGTWFLVCGSIDVDCFLDFSR